jgi:adenylate kinase family enzyme
VERILSLKWQKIHLIGGPGSGKTSAGVALAHRFGLPHLDLDEIFWEWEATTFGPQTAPPVRDAALIEFIAQRTWVVEGAYVGPWLLPSFTAAEAVIALRPAVWVRDWRFSTRWLQRKLGLRPQKQHKRETLKGLWDLYRYNHRYDQTTIPEAKALLAELGRPLIEVRTLEQLLKYVMA